MSYTLRTAQAAKLLEERCDLHYNHNVGCPAKEFFASDCPFAKPCGQATKEGWVRVLEKSGPNTLYNDFSREAHMYGVTIGISFTVRKSVRALSPHAAKSQAEADIRELLEEACLLEHAKITVEDCNKEDK